MKPEIIVEIDPGGDVSIEVKGVPGRRCVETTRFLEGGLGEILDRQLKDEYFLGGLRRRTRIRTGGAGEPDPG